jgi:hypothetical protein
MARYTTFATIDRNAQKTGHKGRFSGVPDVSEGMLVPGRQSNNFVS